ncbi:MAG: hypothetical protein OMM_03052 [Candidatus Magnetoglobus multicellularis str. Araruama]|uniref:Carboxypeptidase regulatory-like domain-containing protein n=1 Tax=Candidatus Magnetoglobus multicellularis str. Araruama TaxID=890399 RepID=A0A1V1P7E2_9BACT|nr:MAG: hypothetical protein OMM_03052 [Candidatus Magnetoglobus multicellularis str. Araruama]
MVIQGIVFMENINTTASEGLWVNIWSKSTRTGGDVATDTNGRYQIAGLNPNASDYIISIRKQDYMASFYRDNNDSDLMNDTVYISDDAEGIAPTSLQWAVNRNLILRRGLSISGQILHNGFLVSDIRVEAWSESTKGWGVDVSEDHLTDNHNYIISGLPPGEYIVQVKPLYYQDDAFRVDLINTDVTNFYFPLKELENSICGTVHGLDVNHSAQVTAWSEGIRFNKSISIVGTGNALAYTISNVKPSSDYRVKFTAYDYPLQVYNNQTSEENATIIPVSNGTISGIDFFVSSGRQAISGTVEFPMSAVAGDIVWVDAFSDSTGSSGSAEVVFNDTHIVNYQVTGLKEADDFIVVAWGKQFQEQYYKNKTTADNATLVNTSEPIPDHGINFDMNHGASISGIVYQDGFPTANLQIMAISDKTLSFGGSTSASDGSYLIEALDLADDYIIKVKKSGMAPFYYHTTGSTRDEHLATKVSTVDNRHVTGVDIHLATLESISGTVRDEEGKALSGIWVNVWSDLQQCGEGIYTSDDGTYKIDALSKSDDYKVSIGEHAALVYVPEEKQM